MIHLPLARIFIVVVVVLPWGNLPYPATFLKEFSNETEINGSRQTAGGFTSPTKRQADTTPPVTNVKLIGTLGDNEWFKSDVIVSFLATDDSSDVADIFCAIDGDPTIQSCQEPFDLTEEGLHEVEFYAKDTAGNTETMQWVEIKIDKTPPEIDLDLDLEDAQYTRITPLVPHWEVAETTAEVCDTYGWVQTPGGTIVSNEPIMSDQPYDLFWLFPQVHEFRALARDCAGWETEVYKPFEVVATLESMQYALILLPAQDGIVLSEAVYKFLHGKLVEAQRLQEQKRFDSLTTLLEDTFIEPERQFLPPRVADMFVMDAWYIIYTETVVEPTPMPTPTPSQAEPTITRPSVTVGSLDDSLADTSLYVIESDEAAVQKTGAWAVAFALEASAHSYLYSSGGGRDTLQLNFTGARINVVFTEHIASSEFAIELDGERVGTVTTDALEAQSGAQALVRGFPSGRHTLRIIALSGNVAIDAFLVDGRLVE